MRQAWKANAQTSLPGLLGIHDDFCSSETSFDVLFKLARSSLERVSGFARLDFNESLRALKKVA